VGFLNNVFGIGGGSAAQREGAMVDQGESQLGGMAGFAFPFAQTATQAGTATTKQGLGTLGQAQNYWQNILSGYRPAQMAAIAPEIASIDQGAAAARSKQGAYGTARGGGTAAANANADTSRMTQINQALFGTRPVAAQEMKQIGSTQANIGQNQISEGLRALGLSEDAIKAMMEGASGQEKQDAAYNQGAMGTIGRWIATAASSGFLP